MREMRLSILEGHFLDFYNRKRVELVMTDQENPPRPMSPSKLHKKEKRLQLGDYEVHDSGLGFSSIRQKSSGEVMHSVNPPQEEARHLYVLPAKIEDRLSSLSEIVIWDVGLGAAHNSMALIHEFINKEFTGKIRIVSFENDTDPLKLALRNAHSFPHLHHAAPHDLLKNNQWVSPKANIQWELIQGDFSHTFIGAPKPHVIFYDPFSIHTNGELWSEDIFAKIFDQCRGNVVQLINYSASTAVRATLLAVGFSVGHGPATGPKSTTTFAYNDASLAHKQGVTLLGQEWLTRWEKSDAKSARGLSQSDEREFEEKIRRHEQFRNLNRNTTSSK
jgi:queuine tRNA-ribosyltransferase